MRTSVSLTATGYSTWVIPDYRQRPPNIQLNAEVPAGGATFSVLYTNDDLISQAGWVYPTSITRSTTTATVTSPNHGLNTNDLILVFNTGFPDFQATSLDVTTVPKPITVTDNNTFTYTVTNSGISTAATQAYYVPARVFPAAAMTAKSARTDGNIAFPCSGIILNVTAYTGPGPVVLQVIQGPSSA